MRQFCRRTAPCDSGQMRLTVLDRETQACPLCRITGIRTLPRHKLRNKIGGPGSFRGNRGIFFSPGDGQFRRTASRRIAELSDFSCPSLSFPRRRPASRPFGAYAIRGTFRNRLPLRGRTEHACHRLPCSERVHRRIHRGRKRPKKRVRTARGRGCKASRRPPAHMQFGEPFATVCRCAAERNMHATACPVRSGFIGESTAGGRDRKRG